MKSAICCGLDFGTSNSTIGIIKHNTCQLVPLEGDHPIMRSAIFCDAEQKRWVFGQHGINRYMEGGQGRLLMALKSVLGSPLMNDETLIFAGLVSYSQILGHFIKELKSKAENAAGQALTHVVMGRPVHFHDTDKEQDQRAQQTLEDIARQLGFQSVSFQYEPIAAAMSYEATLNQEQLALIVDMGGGTSDFTIIRLQPNNKRPDRTQDVLANYGVHIAGTDFDQSLSLHAVMPLLGLGSMVRGSSSDLKMPVSIYHDLTMWHLLNLLYTPVNINHLKKLQAVSYEKNLINRLIRVIEQREGHHILQSVETCKQNLSSHEKTTIDLSAIEEALDVVVTQAEFNDCILQQVDKIILKVSETLTAANVKHEDITAIFYTGGSSKVPIIRQKINAMFPRAEVVHGDAFGSVGMGLTIEAMKRV